MDDNEAVVTGPTELSGAQLIEGTLCFRGIPVHQMRAWPISLAARMLGLCYKTLRADIDYGRLILGPHDRIGVEALDNYMRNGRASKK